MACVDGVDGAAVAGAEPGSDGLLLGLPVRACGDKAATVVTTAAISSTVTAARINQTQRRPELVAVPSVSAPFASTDTSRGTGAGRSVTLIAGRGGRVGRFGFSGAGGVRSSTFSRSRNCAAVGRRVGSSARPWISSSMKGRLTCGIGLIGSC